MTEVISWTNEIRKLSELKPWLRNPRQIKTDQAKRLVESFEQFGQVETVAVGPDGEIYNGHQRLNVLMAKYGSDYEVEVRVSSRPLTEKEREKLTVFLHKGAAGEWDFDTLSEWDIPDLIEWGFKPFELGVVGDPNDPNKEWEGMPEFEQNDKNGIVLTVHFFNKIDKINFHEKLSQVGININDTTRSFWYPERPEELKHQTNKGIIYYDIKS